MTVEIPKIQWEKDLDLRDPLPPTLLERIGLWLRDLRWRYSINPSFQLRMSTPGRWFFHQFRKECYASVTVHFKDGIYAFTCHKKRWHEGPCEDKVLAWSCNVPRKEGMIRYDEVNRRKFDVLRRKPSTMKNAVLQSQGFDSFMSADGNYVFHLPKDRSQIMAWLRYYERMHPYFAAIVDLHQPMGERVEVEPFEIRAGLGTPPGCEQ